MVRFLINCSDDENKKNLLESHGKGDLFNLLRKTATQFRLKDQLTYKDIRNGRSSSFFEELNRNFPLLCLIFFERRVRSKSDGIVIRYKEFRRCKEFVPEIFKQFFAPSIYGKMFKDCCGFISPTKFINCCLKILYTFEIRSELGLINPVEEIITYYDFYYWIKTSINDYPHSRLGIVKQLSESNPNFETFYAIYVIERILFFYGNRNSILRIQDLISSEQFAKFIELRLGDTNDVDNPFNPQMIYQLFELFEYRMQSPELDVIKKEDQINETKKSNLKNLKPEYMVFLPETLRQLLMDFEYIIPELVISRIFEVHSNDCKEVLDQEGRKRIGISLKCVFKILFSLEFKDSVQALNWFWDILDLNEVGYIDLSIIHCFWKEMTKCIELYSIEALPLIEHISDEIFDMIAPGNSDGKIYKKFFLESPMASTVISYLCDPKAFIAIEMREEMIAQAASRNQDVNQLDEIKNLENN